MPRGGKRERAGRKSTWASARKVEDTTVIRIPKEFAITLLEMAHKLDSGKDIDFVTNSIYDIVTQSNEKKLGLVENVTESKKENTDLVTESMADENLNFQSLNELVADSKANTENQVEPKNDFVTESESLLNQIKNFAQKWTRLAEKASLKNGQWIKARLMVRELNELIPEVSTFSDLVTETEENTDLVTESKNNLVTEENITEVDQLNLLETDQDQRQRLLKRRNLGSLTITALAARLKVHHATISRYRAGRYKLTLEEWSKTKDPDGVGWVYSEELQKCVPLL